MKIRSGNNLAWTAAFLVTLGVSGPSLANVMTFDPLSPDGSSNSNYTEDGINISGAGGGHFHAESGGAGDTEARMFNSDAFPQTVTMGGIAFNLVSIDLNDFVSGIDAVLTSSSGAVAILSVNGTFSSFGAGFSGITSFTITSQQGGVDLSFDVDNITTSTGVPLPGTLFLLALGLAGLGVVRRTQRA